MTLAEALQVLVDCAGRWGENTEEQFPRRIKPTDTDEALAAMRGTDSDGQSYELSDMQEVRDLWLAVEIASREINKAVEPSPR